jgi:hypothetical protein
MDLAKSFGISSKVNQSWLGAGVAKAHRNLLRPGILLIILSIPSLYIFLTLPPLWRDEDAFNQIVSPFAPAGIIHFLPGYCLGGRLIIFAGSIVASLWGGHGIPRLSISDTPLTDAGVCTLIVVQHLFLVFSLFYVVRTISNRFPIRLLAALVFALTPWLYIFANCIGTEAFSNPLVYLIAAFGWSCLRTTQLNRRMVCFYFVLLLAAALTRQINILLTACLPIALLPLAAKELIFRDTTAVNPRSGQGHFRHSRRLLIFVAIGLSAIGTSLLVQQTMCWFFKVPFRSTYGETFEYRLSYLEALPEQERAVFLDRISAKVGDPIVTEALQALNQSLTRGDGWVDVFLPNKINEILQRSGFHETPLRIWQVHLKLNRIATAVLLSGDPKFLEVVWTCFVVSPFFSQTDFASAPFGLTDWLLERLHEPKYARLRVLATFQHDEGYYNATWWRMPYARLWKGIPMLEMACVTIAFAILYSGLALTGVFRDPVTEAGVSCATGLIIVAVLIALVTCLSTYFQARLFLPVYTLFQMGMLMVISLATNIIIEEVSNLKKLPGQSSSIIRAIRAKFATKGPLEPIEPLPSIGESVVKETK